MSIQISPFAFGRDHEEAENLGIVLEGLAKRIHKIGEGTLAAEQIRAIDDEITELGAIANCLSRVAWGLAERFELLRHWAEESGTDIPWPPVEIGIAIGDLRDRMVSELRPTDAGKLKRVR